MQPGGMLPCMSCLNCLRSSGVIFSRRSCISLRRAARSSCGIFSSVHASLDGVPHVVPTSCYRAIVADFVYIVGCHCTRSFLVITL